MLTITLPDGQTRSLAEPITGADFAKNLPRKVAQEAVAISIDKVPYDLNTLLDHDVALEYIMPDSDAGLDVLRHSCAHLMAHAVKQLYPTAQVTIGPVIENGFYYDFDYERAFNEDDLKKIEERMLQLSKQNFSIQRSVMGRSEACSFFNKLGEKYKVEIIESIPENEAISFYTQGDFIDLCTGPHVPATSYLKHFKLMKVAGAYWRGDQNNKMLQRIYGTCFAKKSDLDAYLTQLAEAQARDHRKIGVELDLFHMQEEAPGMIFWHPQGWTLFRLIEQKIRSFLGDDYQEVKTPQVVDRSLWERSGHWGLFKQNMFQTEIEEKHYAIKPMNCPCHVQIFNQDLKSYRDLPLRLAEFGSCHRFEPSGALHGLMRLRNFTQDDAHIFCTPEQIQEEVSRFNQLLLKVYKSFGFHKVAIKLSTRPSSRVGDDALWDQAENALATALKNDHLEYQIQPGEGAFYGPKVEFVLQDCLGRKWQCGTVQLDFSMPQRLEATYIDPEGVKRHPVMIHRAILGSLERFIGIMIEHHAGALPFEFAPTQCVILPISEKYREYAHEVHQKLKEFSLRAHIDLRNEKIGYKIRHYSPKKIPYLIIVGEEEMTQHTISVRTRQGEQLQHLSISDFYQHIQNAQFVLEETNN